MLFKMDSKYTVPVIPQNLHKHETIIQIAEVLDYLKDVSEVIFAQINKRLENNRSKLQDITKRVDTVNRKIDCLRGAKKATQVFSSSRYPASDIYKEYSSLFYDAPVVKLKRHPVKVKNAVAAQAPLEKLQFYHVSIQKNKETKVNGLGDMPQNIEFVNDLLLYNTGKNLYKDFVISYNLKSPQHIKEDEEHESEIGAAPKSISERSTQSKAHKESYFYTPQIGEVPALDVPLDLPDLPGIANDLHYNNDVNSSIAPSADISPSILELDIQTTQNLPTIPQEDENEEITNISCVDLPPVPESKPELPSPPHEIQKPEKTTEIREEVKKPLENIQVPTPSLRPADDLRSNLMEAIRSAGGSGKAKLKSVQSSKEMAKNAPPGGDLLADLHNKLFMRRKGISGAKQSQDMVVDADAALSRISSLIPPPEPANDPESTSNDEDWDE